MKKLSIVFLFILPVLLISAGKVDFFTQLHESLKIYTQYYAQEKVYLQTDKTYYKQGENIWFNAFLVNADDNKPSSVSDILYVELSDPRGNTIEKHELVLKNGMADSDFEISKHAPGGIYKLTAYTQWMKNWGTESFFSKEITVQKVITPRLLLKLDFEKRAYGAGDEVTAALKVTDLKNVKASGSIINATVRIKGVTLNTFETIVNDGEAEIKFKLPENLDTEDGILQILVTDKGIEESITRSIPIVLNKIDMQFYPEGGDIVENIPNKIAFEALNEFGKGAGVSGQIYDDSDKIVAGFESFHLGMGTFVFTPQPNKKYYAKITNPAGNNEHFYLPESLPEGYVMSLHSQDKNNLHWHIYAPENGNVNIVGQTQGSVRYAEKIFLKKGLNMIDILTDDFPIGITVFTLFDKNNQETCERLVFLNADKGLQIKIETNDVYYPGTQARIKITTSDKNGNPVAAGLGIAVVDEQLLSFADDKQDNLLSSFLLSSELKGEIQEPYFYFDESEKKAKEAIDFLMLTHGWRRFTWNDVLNPNWKTLKELPEKTSSVYGYVLDKNGKSKQAEVFLIETRIGKIGRVKTTRGGHFAFHNIDPTSEIIVTTQLPNQVYLFQGTPDFVENDNNREISDNEILFPSINIEENRSKNVVRESLESEPIYSFSESRIADNVSAMSIVTVAREYFSPNLSLESTLARAGLDIIQSGIVPVESAEIQLRKTAANMSDNNPLIVINGVPLNSESDFSFINPKDIQSISVIKNGSTSVLYGNKAANGVVDITTTTSQLQNVKYKPAQAKFGGVVIKKRQYYDAPKFSQYSHNNKNINSTVFWQGNVQTSKYGTAYINFTNNIQSSTYRITAEGIAFSEGLIGSASKRIVTKKDFSIDAKSPLFAGIGDIIKIPVIITNNTDTTLTAFVGIDLWEDFLINYNNVPKKQGDIELIMNPRFVDIPANEAQTIYFSLKAEKEILNHSFRISAYTKNYSDEIEQNISIRQINFPYHFGFSGKDKGEIRNFELPNGYIQGTLQAEVEAYPGILDELFAGVESIFREPYGCFEQVSSSTFPNIFALQLLQASNQNNPQVRGKAMQYLENGYKKLAAYEVKGGGFEWYGGSPAHEVLSAYGLVEFYEMNKVYDKVDKSMIDRTRDFILSRKDGKGGFLQNNGRYGFSGAPRNVNNAYIVYALTETGYGQDIESEYQSSLKEAMETQDLYRMALMTNAAFNKNDLENYIRLKHFFEKFVATETLSDIKIDASIVYSYHNYSQKETVAFWTIALLKDKENIDLNLIEKCIEFINKGRSGGSFGSTQTTSICLQALTKYAQYIGQKNTEGSICLNVNNEKICNPMTVEKKTTIDFTDKLEIGNNRLQISFADTEEVYPYSLHITWQTKIPPTSKNCPLKLSTKLNNKTIKINETVRLTVILQNTYNEGKPMSVAVIGIPGGLSLQPWQLKELQEKEVFDFYEIINDNLVIYYRELGPKETKTIQLDLKAEIPGRYTGIASSAYIYYSDVDKYWVEGLSVSVEE